MRKFVVLPDGDERELSPFTYLEFVMLDRWIGGSDVAWSQFLSVNNFTDLSHLARDGINPTVEIREGEPRCDWSRQYGSLIFQDGKWQDT